MISRPILGQVSERGPERGEHLRGVPRIEEIDEGGVVPLDQLDFQVGQEPADGEPEIVAHQHDRLHVLAVALPQGGDQLGIFLAAPGVQPLLELVDHEQELLARRQNPAFAHRGQRIRQPRAVGQGRAGLFQSGQQPLLGLIGGRLDVHANDVLRTVEARAPPSPATTCRSPRGRRSGRLETSFPASVVSICVFQKRMLSGKPSRLRGPGSSSRKKSASCSSKDRRPLGTILMGRWSESERPDGVAGDDRLRGWFGPRARRAGIRTARPRRALS